MNSVRHLNKLKTVPQKTAHLIYLQRFNGIKFVESVLSIPELNNAEELKRITLHAFAFKTLGWIGRFLAKRGKALFLSFDFLRLTPPKRGQQVE